MLSIVNQAEYRRRARLDIRRTWSARLALTTQASFGFRVRGMRKMLIQELCSLFCAFGSMFSIWYNRRAKEEL